MRGPEGDIISSVVKLVDELLRLRFKLPRLGGEGKGLVWKS